jgi:phosphoribosylanthranilate isomerase
MRTRLKVCCMMAIEEAREAVAQGADAVGLVGAMPSGPGPIDDALAAEIARAVPPPVATFLLTSFYTGEEIAGHVRKVGATCVQIVRHIEPREYAALRRLLHGVKIVQVIHVEDCSALGVAQDYAKLADALLLDSGRPKAMLEELGGTGRAHDWDVSARIVVGVGVPVFLAGGLNAGNVAEAVRQVRPYGVDLCSGVRTDGKLDAGKLRAFVAALGDSSLPRSGGDVTK